MTDRWRGAPARTALGTAAVLLVAACTSATGEPAGVVGDAAPDSAPVTFDPELRAVSIRTTGCGDASRTTGTGVIVGQANVLTAAHVVVGATDVFVDGADEPAPVFLLDRTRDLALLKVPAVDAPPVELADARAGDAVRVVGGAASGTVEGRVERLLRMTVDDVRSSTRSVRSGFELDVAIEGGDSGAGVFDADGRLVGIVFAVPTEGARASFAVDASEIAAVLDAPAAGEHRCDPARAQLVPTSSEIPP